MNRRRGFLESGGAGESGGGGIALFGMLGGGLGCEGDRRVQDIVGIDGVGGDGRGRIRQWCDSHGIMRNVEMEAGSIQTSILRSLSRETDQVYFIGPQEKDILSSLSR